MQLITQNQTAEPLVFLMIDEADHVSPKTGLSPTVTISKNGGSFASPTGSVTEIGNGLYQIAGNATDANTLGPLVIHATGTGADPSDTLVQVVAPSLRDAVRLGLTAMPNANAGANGGLPTGDANGRVAVQVGTSAGQINSSGGKVPATIAAGDLAADSVTASALAADAVTEIQNGLATASALSTVAGYLDTEIAAILADTNELQTDLADGGRLDLILDGILADTNELQSDWTNGGRLDLILDGILDDTGISGVVVAAASVSAIQSGLSTITTAQVNAEVDTALADYDGPTNAEMVARTLAAASYATAAGVSAVETKVDTVDTVVDAILADTGTDGVVVAAGSKTGYALASTGLDSISTTAPSGVASNFREMLVQVWRRFFKKAYHDADAGTLKTYADDGTTVVTTQTLSEDADGNETQGAAS